jgi:hypothetical protein
LVGQEFEVRASHLLGRFSTTCATPPADSYSLIYYLEIFSFFLNLGVQDFTRMCSDMFSLHILPGIWFTFNLMIQVFLCQRKIFFYFLGYHAFLASKPSESSQALVVHACNLSYSGGRDQEDCGSKPAGANSSRDPILKKTHHKEGLLFPPFISTWERGDDHWWSGTV